MSKLASYLAPSLAGAAGAVGIAYMLADQFVHDIPAPARGIAMPSPAEAEDAVEPTPVAAAAVTEEAPLPEGGFGLGRAALPEEVAAWDLDVSPDATGLPPGSGSVEDGEMLFSENCAACHGEFAEGVGNWPKLAGGDGTLADEDPLKTVGSYWPYLSTTWDYVHRSMPFGAAQTLTADEVYAITAYILYSNYLVEDDFVLTNENFLEVEMPNAEGFFVDDRAETEYSQWRTEPCMTDCKESVEITMRATVLDVTPEETAEEEAEAAAQEQAAAEEVETAAAEPAAAAESAETPDAGAATAATAAVAADPELVAAGEKVFGKCKACHQVGDGAKNRTGPELNGILGRPIGSVDGFRYSQVFTEAHEQGQVWDAASLGEYLSDPKGYMKGTKMAFAGLKKDADIEAVLAYLQSAGN